MAKSPEKHSRRQARVWGGVYSISIIPIQKGEVWSVVRGQPTPQGKVYLISKESPHGTLQGWVHERQVDLIEEGLP